MPCIVGSATIYQCDDLPEVFSAMNLSTDPYDSTGYLDTRATNHMIADASSITHQFPYNGQGLIVVVHGNTLPSSSRVNHGWHIKQLNVKNAFLHGTLHEVVFMHQPLGFVDKNYPNHLHNRFDVKDSGDLHFFLSIEAHCSSSGIELSQSKYALNLFKRSTMLGEKPCSSPITYDSKLSLYIGDPLSDASTYRSIVGALQYLTMTLSDITHAVNQVCQLMHQPRTKHLIAVKRIFHYIKGTPNLGITIQRYSDETLQAYSDAYGVGCLDSSRSISAICVFVGLNLLTWNAKKQPIISRSRAEAEYHARTTTIADIRWILFLLYTLHIFLPSSPVIQFDKVSATYLAFNPLCTNR
ncbi:uncharacterized protein LOC110007930 [Amborella trichopoda]|uniref:uncharacterized protein LOC110007930 n=1 Tax=Amborella trichopoda TaxID=13333 RepID=UPI0009C054FC|nr:uncharacterized protein LOC110007930 [Amborella trichopoda]|eukprot:XP_020527968.1 uncharacterized protein LOC110007930 [Amborella trichopoda]